MDFRPSLVAVCFALGRAAAGVLGLPFVLLGTVGFVVELVGLLLSSLAAAACPFPWAQKVIRDLQNS